MRTKSPYEEILHGLVHDLRQPLGTIETSIFCLDLMLDKPSERVRDQLRAMEHQVAEAAELLERAAEELRFLRAQCPAEEGAPSRSGIAESFARTNSATAAVT